MQKGTFIGWVSKDVGEKSGVGPLNEASVVLSVSRNWRYFSWVNSGVYSKKSAKNEEEEEEPEEPEE